MIVDLVTATQQEQWGESAKILYNHWLTVCPKLFAPNPDHPWEQPHNDKLINEELFVPLTSAFCADSGNQSATLLPLNDIAGTSPQQSSGHICGHVFRSGELTYTCKDCATDVTCVMCLACFESSIHKNHKYKMHASSGSGYCDCGDVDAWSEGHVCSIHSVKENSELTQMMPEDLVVRVRRLIEMILGYCVSLISYEECDTLPPLLQRAASSTAPCAPHHFLTVLYNDETHTYENVIRVLELCIHCSKDQAMLVATIVDREGRSAVKMSNKGDCIKVKEDVMRRTQRDVNAQNMRRLNQDRNLPLHVKVMDSDLFAHQNHAISLLAWLCAQMENFPPLRRIVGDVLLYSTFPLERRGKRTKSMEHNYASQPPPKSPTEVVVELPPETTPSNEKEEVPAEDLQILSFAELLLKCDSVMWKAARVSIHQMLMKTVLMNLDQKYEFARVFMRNFDQLYHNFIEDDHDMDVSVISLTVQFLTVPTIAKRLIAEEDALSKVIETLLSHTASYLKRDEQGNLLTRFDFATRTFPNSLRRAMQMTRDGGYMLNSLPTPSEWSDDLRKNFLQSFDRLTEFLDRIEGMDEVKRQSVEHQVWDSEWETAFNIQIRIKDVISMMVAWANSDKVVHNEILSRCLTAWDRHPVTVLPGENGETHFLVNIDGEQTYVKAFEVSRGGVSIHHPLVRFTAALFISPFCVDFFLKSPEELTDSEKGIVEAVSNLGRDFYEPSLRVLVLCAQASAQLWRRNGFSLVNQIHNYFSPLCRNEMYDRDILMMQVGAARLRPQDFVLHLLSRYRLASWAEAAHDGTTRGATPYGRMEPEEMSKITVIVAEELFHLLIIIIGERYLPGVGETTLLNFLKREVVHVLCTGSQPYSTLQQKMSHDILLEKVPLHEAVNAVSDFRKPVATSAGQFHLRESFYCEYNPFFYHYSRSDQSQAEQYQHKIRSNLSDNNLRACPPPMPPKFTPFFSSIPNILLTPVLIKIFRVVLERTARRNRFSSDRLLHKSVYLIAMALNEQTRDPGFEFTRIAQETCDLLSAIEALRNRQEGAICHLLIDWVVLKYRELMNTKIEGPEEKEEKNEEENRETVEEAKARRAARAAQMRANAMQQMTNMQQRFMNQMEEERTNEEMTEENSNTSHALHSEDEDKVRQIPSSQNFPVCLGPNRWRAEVVIDRTLTCILCQEKELVHPTNGNPMVCAAFVQQSQLFTHKSETASLGTHDQLVAPSTLRHGIDASTCSHTMHYECYKQLADSSRNRDGLRTRQQIMYNQRMVDPEGGEYQCPLCKRLSNAAMPILPAMQSTDVSGFSTVSASENDTFNDWITRLRHLLDVSSCGADVRKKGHSRKRSHSERSLLDLEKQSNTEKAKEEEAVAASVDGAESNLSTSVPSSSAMSVLLSTPKTSSTEMETDETTSDFYNELAAIWNHDASGNQAQLSPATTPEPTPTSGTTSGSSTPSKPSEERKAFSAIQHALCNLIRPIPAIINPNRLCGPAVEQYEDAIKDFGKCLVAFRRRGSEQKARFLEKHLRGIVTASVTWQSTAHVARAISAYLQFDNKPLFGALNTRHRDCLCAMTRLCASVSYNMQMLPNAIADMLRILLCEPPKPRAPVVLQTFSSTPVNSSIGPSGNRVTSHQLPVRFTLFVQLFSPTGSKKQANLNILHVDILSLTVSLMMSIGWTWHNGVQKLQPSVPTPKQIRQLVPDGSIDELYVLRLCLIASYYQIIATFNDDQQDDEMLDEEEKLDMESTYAQIQKLWNISRPGETLRRVNSLYKALEEGSVLLLRPIALIYHFLTLVDPPEALKDPSINSTEALYRYLGLPHRMEDQITGQTVEDLFTLWAPSLPQEPSARADVVRQPVRPNLLIDLPFKYSDLINNVSNFRCPSIPIEEPTSNIPTICLVCGQVLCSQGYCCQKIINKETLGSCRYHMRTCSGSVGAFLRVRDCTVFMMTTRKRGCFRAAPYVDEFGEVDQGFRRGNPLHLNAELYHKLKLLWIQQGITEEVVNRYDMDHRNMQFDWAHF
ncbi:unnamed protein product [Caenorhabditis auriculariae]|uniref:E3 ubiquitin-protein ligase n=1 Tax=Caenorhabditis auriculariae TaxID=2777116 RepID=A0A8S1HCK0_9PELO|nr:unnamed protein product [Caenorhabditis auriculariae]